MSFFSRFFSVKTGEWKLVLALFSLLALNTMTLELAEVVSMAGFVSNVGASGILWLWSIGAVVSLVFLALYLTVVDRFQRVMLIRWMLGLFVVCYLVLLALFYLSAPDWLTYPALFVVSDQQFMLFPMVFWALVNDIFTVPQGKRLIPLIAGGYAVGSITGNALASLSGMLVDQLSLKGEHFLLIISLILFFIIALVEWAFRGHTVRARQEREQNNELRQTIKVGIEYFTRVRIFRTLGMVMLLAGIGLAIIEFNLIYSIDNNLPGASEFQTFYGAYKLGYIIVVLLLQSFVSSRMLKKVALKNTFLVLPVMVIVSAVLALALPGLLGAATARFLARSSLVAWDDLARKSVQGMVPDERRGRVSSFMDGFFFSLATLLGCALLGIMLLLGSLYAGLNNMLICLFVAALMGVAALAVAVVLQRGFDSNLLDWHLVRPRRASRLDGIEF